MIRETRACVICGIHFEVRIRKGATNKKITCGRTCGYERKKVREKEWRQSVPEKQAIYNRRMRENRKLSLYGGLRV